MASVGTITANLIAKTHGYTAPLQKAGKVTQNFAGRVEKASKKIESLSRATQKIAAQAGAMGTALGLAGLKLIDLASDAQETQAKFDVVFGDLASDTNKWAEEFGSTMGRSKTDIKAWSSEIQNVLGAIGFTRGPATDLSKSLVELAVDVGAFMNAADSDVIDNFLSALTGSHKAVRKYGIVINQVTMAEELRRMGIRKSLSQVDELTKTQARYNIIMRATRDAQGAAIREADGWANQVKALGGDIKNLSEDLGQRLEPAGSRMLGWVRSAVGWFNDLDDGVKNNIVRWGFLATALLTGVTVFALLGTGVLKAIQAFALFGKGLALLINPVVLGLALLAGGALLLYTAWTENWWGIQEKTKAVWEVVQPIFIAIWDWLTRAWKWTINTAGDVWDWLVNTTWQQKWDDIKKWMSAGWDWVVNTAGKAWGWFMKTDLGKWIEDLREKIVGSRAWQWTINTAGDAWDWLTNTTWEQKWSDIKGWMSAGWRWVIDTAGTAWSWFKDTELGKWLDEMKQKITDSAGWKWIIDVAVPWVAETGEMIIKAVIEAGGRMYDAIKKGFDTGDWSDFWVVGSDLWSKGVLLAVGLASVVTGFGAVKTAIIAGLGLVQSFGAMGVIGALTVAIKLKEAEATGNYKQFGESLAMAIAAGLGIGMFTGSPYMGALAFTVVLNLDWNWLNDEQKNISDLMTEYTKFREEWEKGVPWTNDFGQLGRLWSMSFGKYKVPKMTTPDGMPTPEFQYYLDTGQIKYDGFASGTPWTGYGPINEIAGVVHKQEAVIPWQALRKGMPGILEFLGYPGFQDGKNDVPIPDVPEAVSKGSQVWTALVSIANSFKDLITTGLKNILGEELYGKIEGAIGTINKELDALMGDFGKLIEDAEKALNPPKEVKPPTLWEIILKGAGDAWEWLKDKAPWLTNVLEKSWTWTIKKGGDAWEWLSESKLGKIVSQLYKITGAKWVVDMSIQLGSQIFSGVVEGVTDALPSLQNAAISFSEAMAAGTEPVTALIIAFANLLMRTNTFIEIIDAIVGPLGTLLHVLGQSLKPLIPIAEWVGEAFTWVAETVVKVWNNLIDALDFIWIFGSLQHWKMDLEEAAQATRNATEAMRNVPSGLKIVANRLSAAGYGSIPSTRSGPIPNSNTTINENVYVTVAGDIYGVDDLDKRIQTSVAKARDKSRLASVGVR